MHMFFILSTEGKLGEKEIGAYLRIINKVPTCVLRRSKRDFLGKRKRCE